MTRLTDKSRIILVKVLDSTVGDVRIRFMDMPVVNIGTATNLFSAHSEIKDYISPTL